MRDVLVKAKAKMGKLPDIDTYLAIANENDISKKIDILSKTYPAIDSRKDKKALEVDNFRWMLGELKSIDFFLQGLESKFYNLYFSKYEILFLQEVIQSLVNRNFKRNLMRFKANPLSENFVLTENMDLESFIKANKSSKYYRTLLPYINKNMEASALIFLSSNALIKFYYRSLLKLAKKFNSKESKKVQRFLGEEINLLNFEMLYRLKTYYERNDSDVFNYLIEGGNKFNGARLKEISLLPKKDFIDRMSKSKYKNIFEDGVNTHMQVRKRELKLYHDEIIKEECDILYVISAMNIMFISDENVDALLEMDESFTVDEAMEYLIVR